jgi:pimeloyl-ACP methyl ester carboxylesterase
MRNSYTNKIVLVTGGTSGIGKATALAFAKAGAKVVITGRREKEGADVVAEITKNGGTAAFVRADVANDADVVKAIAFVLTTHGRLDVAFNNAGVEKFATVTSEGTLEDIAQGLPMAERKLALAVQGQSYGPMFDEKLTVAAWKTKPSWAIISAKDRMLPPAMEESAAKKMNAMTTTLPTCHMVILEEPAKVAAVIDEAAKTALTGGRRSGGAH